MIRFLISLLVALVIGAAIGLYFGWVRFPVQYLNSPAASLADRYNVSVQNLLRVNQLEINQDVYEGQVLYVPVVYAKK